MAVQGLVLKAGVPQVAGATDSLKAFSFTFGDGSVQSSAAAAATAGIDTLDDISSQFNGSTTAFALKKATVSYTNATTPNLIWVLGGVQQTPTTDYTVSGTTMTATTAPASGLVSSLRCAHS